MADFSRITERLLCGAQIMDQNDMSQIVAAGVTHIIDAQAERDDKALIGQLNYLYAPQVDDGVHPKPVAWFGAAVNFAVLALALPKTIVLTHCAAGINRGPSLAYAILRSQGLSRDVAFDMLKKARPQVNVAYRDDADAALRTLGWIT